MNKFLNELSNRAIFNLGFRIFFASGAFYAALCMALWIFIYRSADLSAYVRILPQYWHGHEMVFGYAMAIVAGFLLTAVGNWTGLAMPSGKSLCLMWMPWLAARVIFIVLPQCLWLAVLLDTLFTLMLLWGIGKPILEVKQWRQMGILSKIVLMILANMLCLAAAFGWHIGWYYGLYLGVFVIIGLVLTIGRRVTPFFIKNGAGYPFEPRNSAWIDRISLAGFVAFFIFEICTPWKTAASLCALISALAQTWRLQGWHTQGIWKRPLLWSMFISMGLIVLGQFLYFLRLFVPRITDSLAMHMMAVGGIGLLTLSMMARVSLGHSGRNIHQPPKTVPWALGLLVAATIFRVLLPLIAPQQMPVWIVHAQVLWVIAFLMLVISYFSIWSTPRIDGRPG